MENKEKLQQLMQDEKFLKEILDLETIEEVQHAFKEKGVNISTEDLKSVRELIIKFIDNNYELSEEELEEICGGSAITGILIFILKAILAGIITGGATQLTKKWLSKKI